MRKVPISCSECGWQLGLGRPGAIVPCLHCGCWVAGKALDGELESAASGLFGVAVFVLLALIFAVILVAIFGRSGPGSG